MPISDPPDYDSPRWQVALALSDAEQQAALDAVRTMGLATQASLEALPGAFALASSAAMDLAQAARIAGAAFQGLAAAFSNFPTRRSPR